MMLGRATEIMANCMEDAMIPSETSAKSTLLSVLISCELSSRKRGVPAQLERLWPQASLGHGRASAGRQALLLGLRLFVAPHVGLLTQRHLSQEPRDHKGQHGQGDGPQEYGVNGLGESL